MGRSSSGGARALRGRAGRSARLCMRWRLEPIRSTDVSSVVVAMRRSAWLLLSVLCLAGATALPAHGGAAAPEVLFIAKNRSITAPAVAGSTVVWISGPKRRPGECVSGRKRVQLLGAAGNVRVLTHRRGRNYETSCLFRPVVAGRFVMWSTPGREFIWARTRGQVRGWKACCGQNVEHHHDITTSRARVT